MKIKLASDVTYAIFRFVFSIKKRNKMPLKKNSSVKDSIKLTTPTAKSGSKLPVEIKILTTNVIKIISGRRIKPNFKLCSKPFSDKPKRVNGKSRFSFCVLCLNLQYV